MRKRQKQFWFWIQPLRDLSALLPRSLRLDTKMKRSSSIVVGSLFMFTVIPTLVPAPAGTFREPTPIALAATAADAAAAPTLPGSDASGAANPPGYVAPYGSYANPYYRGNCTYYVASRRQVPTNWHNANNWLGAARRAGWATGSTPQVGAIAQTSAGWAGHVAIVEQVNGSSVRISEMNYYGWGRIDQRWVAASSFNYIY